MASTTRYSHREGVKETYVQYVQEECTYREIEKQRETMRETESRGSDSFLLGTIPIPKSGTLSRIEENAQIFDFEISAEDMAKIDKMHRGKRYDWDPTNVM